MQNSHRSNIRNINFHDADGNLLAVAEYWGVADMVETAPGTWTSLHMWDVAIVHDRVVVDHKEWDLRSDGYDWAYTDSIPCENLRGAVAEITGTAIAYTVER